MIAGAVQVRVDVGAAGEDEAVDGVERLLDRVGRRRDDQRPAAGALDRLTYESGMSAAGSTQAPQLASCAYDVIPTSGFTS